MYGDVNPGFSEPSDPVSSDPGAAAERIGRLVADWNRGERAALAIADVPDAEIDRVLALLDDDRVPLESHVDLGAAVLHRPSHSHGEPAADGRWHLSVPLDGSSHAEHALRYAAAISRRRPSTITLLHVDERGDSTDGQQYLDLAAESMLDHSPEIRTRLLAGEPAGAISSHALDDDVHLVIMSTHGRSGMRRVIAGNVARALVARGRHSVLTVPIAEPAPSHRRFGPRSRSSGSAGSDV